MLVWAKTWADWIKSSLMKIRLPMLKFPTLSLALSKAGSILMAPVWLIGGAVRSVAGSLLGGGWISALLHPVTLIAIAGVFSLGWAYQKGKQHERRAQAQAIVALNKNITDWRRAYHEVDDIAEKRLESALESWRKQTGSTKVISASCKLPATAAQVITEIAGD